MMRFVVVMFLIGCGCGNGSSKPVVEPKPADDSALHAKCCAQCTSASGRDPAGTDISIKPCSSYHGEFNGGPGVDDACFAHFQTRRTILRDCTGR